ncbi:hypothetical protein [Actinomadura rubteroloni]|nr:hypothetical protein [Actinomadura rubteroloni]
MNRSHRHTPNSSSRTLAAAGALVLSACAAVALDPAAAQAAPCIQIDKRHSNCWSSGGGGGRQGGGGNSGGGGGGGWTHTIPALRGSQPGGTTVDPGTPPQPRQPTTTELADSALTGLALPLPVVHTAPRGKTYVGVTTKLWVTGLTTMQATANAAGQAVTISATPLYVSWNLGETTHRCDSGKGCQYTYKRSSVGQPDGRYMISATAYWSITWTCTGPGCDPQSGALPNGESTSVPRAFTVGEIQSNTRG